MFVYLIPALCPAHCLLKPDPSHGLGPLSVRVRQVFSWSESNIFISDLTLEQIENIFSSQITHDSCLVHCLFKRTHTHMCVSQISIWLILPVVICLSQRLSHACLSTALVRWNCEWLIKSVLVHLIVKVTWITVVIQELIHAKSVGLWFTCFYQIKTNRLRAFVVASLDNFSWSHGLEPAMDHSSVWPINCRW